MKVWGFPKWSKLRKMENKILIKDFSKELLLENYLRKCDEVRDLKKKLALMKEERKE